MGRVVPELPFGVRLTVAYDGTEFHGWQAQPRVRTVQETLEAGLDALGLRHSRVRGCSRTDAGVHALAQVASVAVDRELPPRGYTVGLNGVLPDDVVVTHAMRVDRRYDPRHDSTGKLYRYLVRTGPVRDPLTRRRAWQIGPRMARRDLGAPGTRPIRRAEVEDFLDVARMRDAAGRLLGTHDFRAFRAANDHRENTVRTLRSIEMIPGFEGRADLLAIEVRGDAFLKNMVRILAGTLIDVGRGRMEPTEMDTLLEAEGNRHAAGVTAPAHGLTLVSIDLGRGDHPKAKA